MWPFGEKLFENRQNLRDETMFRLAEEVGLDREALECCLADSHVDERIIEDILEGDTRSEGGRFQGTPTFFVAGKAYVGHHPMRFWDRLIPYLLEKQN